MPNKRAKNKVFLGGFVDKKFMALLSRLAKKERPRDRFGFLFQLAREGLAKRGIHVPEPVPTVPGGVIQDEFTDLPMPSYRRYALRKRKKGLCLRCTEKAAPGYLYCRNHMQMNRAYQRKRRIKTR